MHHCNKKIRVWERLKAYNIKIVVLLAPEAQKVFQYFSVIAVQRLYFIVSKLLILLPPLRWGGGRPPPSELGGGQCPRDSRVLRL